MQTWAKRGIQTALVTGGLLMLGTGIASADEDVNPDKPASPLDGRLIVPLNLDNNQIGSPLGPIDGPRVNTQAVNVGVSDVTGNTGDVVLDATAPITGDLLRDNQIAGDVVVPADISGNAIGVLGDAAVTNTSDQSVDVSRPMWANGTGGTLAANIVDLDYTAPIQITGNAVSGLGNAESTSTSTQDSSTTGDVGTNGTGGVLSGNVAAAYGATPIQVTGNALSGGGTAETDSEATTEGEAGGAIFTLGNFGTISGNGAGVPAAIPVMVNDNSVGAAANTESEGSSDAEATAGRQHGAPERDTTGGISMVSNGTGGTIAGTVAQTPVATPVTVDCNAAAGLANAVASCENSSSSTAGGGNRTEGIGGLASGTVGNLPAAVPVDVFSNAGAVGGTAVTDDANTIDAAAGGDNFTHGTNGTGSGTVIGGSATGPVDVFNNAAAGAGDAIAGNTSNTSTTEAGGFNGTSGDNSTGGGNTADIPVALPTEGFGNVVGGLGNATTTETQETKVSSSGGDTSTKDDGGLLASNAVQPALSGPVQVIGNGGGAAGNTISHVDTDNDITAGGDTTATGTGGTLSGNIGQAFASLPAQLFGNNVTAGGIGEASGDVDTDTDAGGDAVSDGTAGTGSGNVVSVPAASALQGFGDSAAALGISSAEADGTTDSEAGGDVTTAGTGGLLDGNVVTGQALPIAQGMGDAVAGLGASNNATGDNDLSASSGGDVGTNGDAGTISGNLVNVPAGVIAQPGGDAVSAIGSHAVGAAESDSVGTAGGSSSTSGAGGFLSGLNGTLPAGADVLLFGVPVPVLAEAIAGADNTSSFTIGESEPMIDLDMGGDSLGGLPITSLPKLPSLSELPTMEQGRTNRPVPGIGQLGSLTDLVGGLTGGSATGSLPLVGQGLPALPGQPAEHLPTTIPGLPGGSVEHLPLVGNLDGIFGGMTQEIPALPDTDHIGSVDDVTDTVPGFGMVSSLPGLAGGAGHGLPGGGPKLPALPSLPGGHAPRAGVPSLPGLDIVTKLLGGALGGGATGGVLPALPALPTGGTAGQLPSVPGVSSLPGLTNLTQSPAVQLPSLTKLPVQPALSGMDTKSVLNPDSASLADTKSQLAKLLGEHPIG
jgi:hypothetical protein